MTGMFHSCLLNFPLPRGLKLFRASLLATDFGLRTTLLNSCIVCVHDLRKESRFNREMFFFCVFLVSEETVEDLERPTSSCRDLIKE